MKKTKKILSLTDVAHALGVTTRHSFVAAPFKAINKAVSNGDTDGVIVVAGMKVPWKLDGKFPVVPLTSIAAFKAQKNTRPQATADYLNRDQLADELGVTRSHGVLLKMWKDAGEQVKSGHVEGTVAVSGETVPWKLFYSKRNLKLVCVPRTSLEHFRQAIQNEPRRASGNEISITRVCGILKVDIQHPVIKSLKDEIERQILEGNTSGQAEIGGVVIPWNLVKAVWGGGSKFGGVSPHFEMSSLVNIAKLLGVEAPKLAKRQLPDTVGHRYAVGKKGRQDIPVDHSLIDQANTSETQSNDGVTRWDVARALGVTPQHGVVNSTFAKLDAEIRKGIKTGRVTIGDTEFDWTLQKRSSGGGSPAPTLPFSSIAAFSELMNKIPLATEDYLSKAQVQKELGVWNSNRTLTHAWTTMRLCMENGAIRGNFQIEGETIHWQLFRSKTGGEFPYIHKSSLAAFRRLLNQDNVKADEIANAKQDDEENSFKPRA